MPLGQVVVGRFDTKKLGFWPIGVQQRGSSDHGVVEHVWIDLSSNARIPKVRPRRQELAMTMCKLGLDEPGQAFAWRGALVHHDPAELGSTGSKMHETAHHRRELIGLFV